MLRVLRISNFATIHRLEIHFRNGLNVLTGETGSGKSIVIDALELLTGGKTNASLIRTGERVTIIEGVFVTDPSSQRAINRLLVSAGAETSEDEEIFLRREIQSNGRSRMFVNDQVVSLGTTRAIRSWILEIHGQGGQRDLTEATTHLEMLDAFARTTSLRQQVGRVFTDLKQAADKLRTLESRLAEKERNVDFLRFQLHEIKAISPQPNEDEELRAEKTLLTNIEQAIDLSQVAYQDLYEGDQSVLVSLGVIRRRLQQLAVMDARLIELPEAVEASMLALSEVVEALQGYGAKLDFSPERLGDVESRLEEIEKLKRKYGCDVQGIKRVTEGLEADLQYWNDLDLQGATLKNDLALAETEYVPLAVELSGLRRAAAPALEARMAEALADTFTERARFIVQIDSATNDEGGRARESELPEVGQPGTLETSATGAFFSAHGADRVEFLFSANPGESARPMGRVASGGELSRLMLTLISTILESATEGENSSPETVVFDEIDVGIGGRAAEMVGHKLRSLAAQRQVLCVTHQPQIARFADHHFVLSKYVQDGRTATKIRELSFEEKVGELARMVGGDEGAEVARKTARWMLGTGMKKGAPARKHKTAPRDS